MVMDDELAYWRTLAEERKRQLDALRALLLSAIDSIGDAHVRAFVSALDTTRPSWQRELDLLPSTTELESAQVDTILADLWRQLSADRDR